MRRVGVWFGWNEWDGSEGERPLMLLVGFCIRYVEKYKRDERKAIVDKESISARSSGGEG